jgi:cell division protein FtsI (penicillin-binding protein 3)
VRAALRPAITLSPLETDGWRRWAAALLLGLLAVAVVARAVNLQVWQRDFLTREGDKRHFRTVALPAFRGAIRDRRGEPLALSAPVDSIWADPSDLLTSPPHVAALARLLGYTPRELDKFLRARTDRQFVYLKRQIDPDEAARILSLKAPGVSAQREYRRYYPAGEVAAQVVGFCDIDGKGQEGIERMQDSVLRGIPGSRRVIRDNTGRIVEDTNDYVEAQPGHDVTLTLDLHLQYIAYRELKAAVEAHHAHGGMIVVADPTTGEILAMASQPGYNPNRPNDRDSEGMRNSAVVDAFEPGSTIKPLLIAQALELGKWKPDSHVDTGPGWFRVGSATIHDTHPNGYIDLAHLLSKSSNIGAAKVGLSLGAQAVWAGYQKFGIGEPVNAGLPGEATSVLRPYREWGEIATATASYGYGISVNALHLIRAYSALADDGLMPALSIVRSATHIPPQRVVSAQTAREVRELLEGVVAPDGTAQRAAVPGYRVAGKTGTVRKAAGGSYAPHQYLSVFIGMAPAEHPRLVAMVMIDSPQGTDYYGGLVAAPVFSNVMRDGLRLLQVPPDLPLPAPAVETAALPRRSPT